MTDNQFKDYVYGRLEAINTEWVNAGTDEDKEAREEAYTTQKRLCETLTPEQTTLFMRYEEAQTTKEGILYAAYLYKEALKDGAQLAHALGMKMVTA